MSSSVREVLTNALSHKLAGTVRAMTPSQSRKGRPAASPAASPEARLHTEETPLASSGAKCCDLGPALYRPNPCARAGAGALPLQMAPYSPPLPNPRHPKQRRTPSQHRGIFRPAIQRAEAQRRAPARNQRRKPHPHPLPRRSRAT
eukprot:CAMPEP_0180148674 /NCGR_PEP_ID=MMETSP0986-20121125/20144_1 /TAXON_ID=697907 /ORGANISM="non described non described, Strain CCMP2293" /LENGTH=145 /DNA_ID=CAMNT_0022094763 /DNA_START=179 /DNA_END=617 /DNA_ORIENTATION=+